MSIAAAMARSSPVSWRTASADGGGAPRPTATTVAVTASSSSSSPTMAGHSADARRDTAAGSDMVRWYSARRSDSAREARRRSRDRRGGCPGFTSAGFTSAWPAHAVTRDSSM